MNSIENFRDIILNIEPYFKKFISFLSPNITATIINGLIILILAVTILVFFFHIIRFVIFEKNALAIVRRKVDDFMKGFNQAMDSEEDNDSDEKKQNPIPLIDIDELKKGLPKGSIIYKRIETIKKMRKHRVKINIDTLQQSSLTSEASRLSINIPSFSTNLSMILGLFGTFCGLTIMVNKISMLLPNPNSPDFNFTTLMTSISDMGTVFIGIKTAFSTSMVGIFTSMSCLCLNFILRAKQISFFHELETFTIEDLISVTVPQVEDQHILEQISIQVSNSFSQLHSILNENIKTLEELNTIEESFKTIVKEIRNITKREDTRNLESVLTLLTETNSSITNIMPAISIIPSDLKKNREMIEKNIKTLEREMDRIMSIKNGSLVFYFPSIGKTGAIVALIISVLIISYMMYS